MITAVTAGTSPDSQAPEAIRRRLWALITEAQGHAGREPMATYGDLERSGACVLSAQAAHRAVRAGLAPAVLDQLAQLLGLGVVQLAAVLDIDRATLRRYAAAPHVRPELRLPTHTGEIVLRLAELEAQASSTFESAEGAHTWLRTPHPLLDGESPLQAAGTSYGAQQVREMLVAIRWGGVA